MNSDDTSSAFEHTRRTLRAMRLRGHASLLVLLVLVTGAWGWWLAFGRVELYVRSQSSRFEVDQSANVINAPAEGVVLDCNLTLGRDIAPGEVLMQIDPRSFELQLAEKLAALRASEGAVSGLRLQLSAERRARGSGMDLVTQTHATSRLRARAEESGAHLKQEESDLMAKLKDAQVASALDAMKVRAEAEEFRLRAVVSAQQAVLDTATAQSVLGDRDVRITGVERDLRDAENQVSVQQTAIDSLRYEIERRTVRAATAGTLVEVVPCTRGMTVNTSQRLGTLLPRGEVRVVGLFTPQTAIGIVRPGQRAIIRVENYPWTQFGTLQGVVTQVGAEPRDGLVRVEIDLLPQTSAIPSTHGLVAQAEVQTEKLAPLKLLLRLAGQPWTVDSPVPRTQSPSIAAVGP